MLALAVLPLPALSAAGTSFSAERMLAHTKVLASDEFEGRAPGSAGEEKTVAYLTQEFKKLGLQPGNPDGTFVQAVPLVGITSRPTLSIEVGGETRTLKHVEEFVGPTSRITSHIEVKNSELIFVGYGIVAPEFGWDDYKDVDVRGKTIVMLINDPPVRDAATGTLDPQVFGGKAMTYYGRWTYKYEIAAAKGAAGCLIVHETEPAAYPWAVVTGSRSRENFELRTPDGNAGHAAMEGWLTYDAAKSIFAAAGQNYERLKKAAATREFRPVPLDARASLTIDSTLRDVNSRNVVAKLEGADPTLRHEYVVYSAHWDHLGRDASLAGDQIFNGALDNASGVAVLIELARAFAELPADQRAKRSILFLSVTAEEKGLLGSRYYAEHPLYPLTHTVANINMDGANTYGRTSDIAVVGLGASTLDDLGLAVAQAQGRQLTPEEHPEHGSYYRSDHFEFAKVGVPAFYPKAGRTYLDQPADFGEKLTQEYINKHYHKVSDEVQSDWTFEGAVQDAEFMFRVGLRVANDSGRPQWKSGSEFKARREAMLQSAGIN
ncbi:M28 family metallopeptidase [Opitutus terrae]|uniref:Peptidase M28 n=1 Tax=Opitutus terrae (strain DSM 11246 / JCM 15787 / PB90-1) TaxID=452637 RepID=B1ZSB9_OPITP|nr:M28 family metallopeptidase [Opitutus terrae]ACB75718.1 peptidase M28 [Opitutus terrae PB90-1]